MMRYVELLPAIKSYSNVWIKPKSSILIYKYLPRLTSWRISILIIVKVTTVYNDTTVLDHVEYLKEKQKKASQILWHNYTTILSTGQISYLWQHLSDDEVLVASTTSSSKDSTVSKTKKKSTESIWYITNSWVISSWERRIELNTS